MVNTKRVLWQFKNFFKDDGRNKDVLFFARDLRLCEKSG